MKPWTSATALIVAGAMLAGSAFAQTTTPSGDPKAKERTKSEGTKSDSGMKSESGRTRSMSGRGEQVKAVQQALKDKGHNPGEVDGKMGPKTQAALRDFQSKEGLNASGRLDAATRSKLGVEAGAGTTGSGTAPSASPPVTGSGSSSGSTGPGAGSGVKK
jgi:peptidoglycan hydrolase-like protein with peptidoglycan-binding domain